MHQETIERICELLYEAAAVPETWPKALAAMANATGAMNAHFAVWNGRENKSDFFASAHPDRGWEILYSTYYGAIAPYRQLLENRKVGEWIAIQHYFDQAFVQRDEHFNDFLHEAVYYSNARILHQLYRSRFRLLRGFSGLWLIYDQKPVTA